MKKIVIQVTSKPGVDARNYDFMQDVMVYIISSGMDMATHARVEVLQMAEIDIDSVEVRCSDPDAREAAIQLADELGVKFED